MIRLEKAIEIGEDLLGEGPQWPPDDRREAVKLLIKATERLNLIRSYGNKMAQALLPGEEPL